LIFQSKRSRKTVTRSFRVDASALEAIEKEGQTRNVSVNTLVNQLLLSYANFDRYFEQLPMIKIASDSFKYALDSLSDDDVGKIGKRTAANVVKSVILSKHGSLNLTGVLDYFRMISDYAKIYAYSESEADGRRTLTIIHKWGGKGSIYYANYFTSVFEMINIDPLIATTENSVTVVFRA
jgi:hypothetical protein